MCVPHGPSCILGKQVVIPSKRSILAIKTKHRNYLQLSDSIGTGCALNASADGNVMLQRADESREECTSSKRPPRIVDYASPRRRNLALI